ncbi:restriction endonuclease subunit S [Streptomyces puniciscabiei]|uniref:restriction endonuclease subunit S n=1 Tax=Streptomyces puniciscabiei TaxID=164348 RepID=UPI0037938209
MGGEPRAGWRYVPLGEAGTWLSGGTPSTSNPAYWDGDIPWISGASLKRFRLTDSERKVTQLGARSGSRLVDRGTTLFIVRGMSLKSEFRIGVAERQVAFGQDCKALIPADGIDPYFLAHAIQARTSEILAMVEDTSHGTGRLDTERLKGLEIGIPSLGEQRRIIAAHTAFERRIAGLEQVREKRLQLLRGLVEQLLSDVDDKRTTLGEVSSSIDAGITLGSHRVPRKRPVGYLRVANVRKGWIDSEEIALLEADERDQKRYGLCTGDVLVVEGHADPDQIARCAVVAEDLEGLVYQNHLFRIRFDDVLPQFAMLWLNSAVVRSYWRERCATSSGLYTINSRMLEHVPFPEVKPEEQQRVVATWAAANASIRALSKRIEKLRTIQRAVVEDSLASHKAITSAA